MQYAYLQLLDAFASHTSLPCPPASPRPAFIALCCPRVFAQGVCCSSPVAYKHSRIWHAKMLPLCIAGPCSLFMWLLTTPPDAMGRCCSPAAQHEAAWLPALLQGLSYRPERPWADHAAWAELTPTWPWEQGRDTAELSPRFKVHFHLTLQIQLVKWAISNILIIQHDCQCVLHQRKIYFSLEMVESGRC